MKEQAKQKLEKGQPGQGMSKCRSHEKRVGLENRKQRGDTGLAGQGAYFMLNVMGSH